MTTPAASSLHELAGARAQVHGLLSRLLLGPPAATDRAALADPGVLAELASIYGGEAVAAWARAAGHGGDAADRDRRERRDFMDLLGTPSARFVQPWESIYRDARDGQPRLCGPSALAVDAAYRERGARYEPKGLADLPDNAGVELAFLAHLCDREQAAAESSRDAEADALVESQRRFVEEHAARWLPVLGDVIAARAESDVYRGVGVMLRAVMLVEERLLRGDPER